MNFLKKSKIFLLSIAFLSAFSTALAADTVKGKIESVSVLESGQTKLVVAQGEKRETIFVNSKTSVESVVSADKIKAGAVIFLSPQGSGGGRRSGRSGFKSPFRGIPKGMQKKLGLPNIPETPDIPGNPVADLNLPEIPKVPKTPKISAGKNQGGEAAAPAAEEQGKQRVRRPVEPLAEEPSEEEKTLFGTVSSDKPLLRNTGEPAPAPAQMSGKKVLSVKKTEQGIVMELENSLGEKETVTFSPQRALAQAISPAGLRKNMQVEAQTKKANQLTVAERITVKA